MKSLPWGTRSAVFVRMLAIQGAWNYETLLGNGIGFAVEPALRLLPGGVSGEAYRAALARQSQYFNAHPYLAAVAVGALARAELDLEDPHRIERFRTATCGPLGSVGDQLVWAAYLPFSALLSLLVFGLGAGPLATVLTFLVVYNAGHLVLRAWGLHVGYRDGLKVASALGSPLLRAGPHMIHRVGALCAGAAIPLAVARVFPGDRAWLAVVIAVVGIGGYGVARLRGRYELWKWSLGVLIVFALIALLRS